MRVSESVRTAAEAALMEGETLSGFVLEAIQFNIQRRAMQQKNVCSIFSRSGMRKPLGAHARLLQKASNSCAPFHSVAARHQRNILSCAS
ncbi:MAG: YlcI/YnfO family protein [Burkholderiales bacterium]